MSPRLHSWPVSFSPKTLDSTTTLSIPNLCQGPVSCLAVGWPMALEQWPVPGSLLSTVFSGVKLLFNLNLLEQCPSWSWLGRRHKTQPNTFLGKELPELCSGLCRGGLVSQGSGGHRVTWGLQLSPCCGDSRGGLWVVTTQRDLLQFLFYSKSLFWRKISLALHLQAKYVTL